MTPFSEVLCRAILSQVKSPCCVLCHGSVSCGKLNEIPTWRHLILARISVKQHAQL